MRGVFILAVVLVATIAPATCQRPWWRGQPIKRLGLGQQQQFRPNGQRQQQFRPNNQWMQQQDPEAAQEMREQMAEQAEQEAEAAEELREQEEERAQKLQEQQAEAAEREAQYAQQMREQQAEYGQQNAFAAQGMHQQDTEAAQELAEEEAEAAEELREQQAEADAEAAQNMYQGEAGQEMEQEQDAEAAQEMAEQEEEAAQELAEQEAEDAEEAAELEAEAAEAEAEAMEDLQEAEAEAAEADAEAMGEQGEAAEGAGEGQGGSLGTSFSLGGSNYGPSMGSGSAGPSFYDPTGGFGGSGGSGGSVSFSYGGYQGASGGQNGGQGGAMGATGGAGGGAGAGPGDIPGGGNIGSNGAATGGVAAGAGNSPTNGVNTGGANGAAPDGAANWPSSGGSNGAGSGGATSNGTTTSNGATYPPKGGATSNGTTTSNGATYPPKGEATNGTANGATGATGSTGTNGNGGAGTQATAGNSQGTNSGNPIPSVADGVGQSIGSSFTETTNVGARNEPNIAFAPAPIAQAPDAQLTPAETAALDNTYMDKHLCGGFLGANGISGQKSLAVLALDYAGMKQALNPCNVPKNGRTTGRTPVNIAFRSGMETHGQDPASAVLRDLPGMIQRYGQTPRKVHLFSWHMPSEHALRSLLTKKRRGGLANVDVALGYVKESKMALFSALLGDTTFTNLLGQLQQAGISVNRVCDTCSQIANMTNWQRKRQGLVNGVDVFDQQAGQCGPVAEVPATDQLALGTPQCKSFQESMGSCVFDQLTAACPWLRHSQSASEQPLTSIMERWSTECGKNLSCWQEKGGYLSFLARSAASCSISQYGASSAIGQCVGAAQNAPLDPAPPTPSM